ncbi:hypothetical protein GSQ54_09215 [Clostridioides difficile]|nr:hypothetical protein [Clostridioides difficile]
MLNEEARRKILNLPANTNKRFEDIENLKEIPNIPYTTDTGECTIENSKKGYLTNFNIHGKTLINLWGKTNSDFSLWKSTFLDGKINILTENDIRYSNFFTINYTLYKPNTVYTIIVDVDKNTLPSTSGIYIHSLGEENSVFIPNLTNIAILGGVIGKFRYKFTTISDLSDCNIVLRSVLDNDTLTSGYEVSLKITILEGDYTDVNIDYSNELLSVGQRDKIELLSYQYSGINIFNKNANFKDNYILQYLNGEELISETSNHKYTLDYIEIEPDTEYTFYNCSRNICWYDENKTFIPTQLNERIIGDKDIFYVARSPKNTKYLRVTIIKDLHDDGNKTFITKGNKYDKKTIPYTLRNLPNGTKDEIIYKNNKYCLIKRCEERTYTDIGNLDLAYTYNNTLLFMGILNPPAIVDSLDIPYVLCNNFKGKSGNDLNNEDNDGCSTNSAAAISFKILKSKLTTQDKNGFNEWIKNNPITIIYQLAEPKEIELGTLNLEQYDTQTKFICNSDTVIPNISFESTQNLGSHIEILRENIKYIANLHSNKAIDLSNKLINGWSRTVGDNYGAIFYKNNQQVNFNLRLNSGVLTDRTAILKLPNGFIPKTFFCYNLTYTITGGSIPGFIFIDPAGYIEIFGASTNTPFMDMLCSGTYYLE